MNRKIWLEDAIEEYIINNSNVDSVDIVLHFKLRADITLESLSQLQKDGRVVRTHLYGFNYCYKFIDQAKNPKQEMINEYK